MPNGHTNNNELLAHMLGKTAMSMPSVRIGLSSTQPTLTGGNITEPSGGAYARLVTSGATWATPANGSTSNAVALVWAQASATWFTTADPCRFFVLFKSTGEFMGYTPLATPRAIEITQTFQVSIGGLTFTNA